MEEDLNWQDYVAEKHFDVPLHALRYSATRRIGMYLSQKKAMLEDIVPNFGGLAELIGFDGVEIQNFERSEENPGKSVLEEWKRRPEFQPTIGHLVQLLAELGREDILTDCQQLIAKEAQFFLDKPKLFENNNLPVQEPTVSAGPGNDGVPAFLTRDEVISQQQVVYDAFVCYNSLGESKKDFEFVHELIARLENPPYNFKLFVPGRDDLAGLSKYEIDAAIISERCRHMIVVLSNNFMESPACTFQSAFAHSLSPDASKKRLIPVIIEELRQMPNIMRFMSNCDFSKSMLREWSWVRLAKTIQVQLSFEDYQILSPYKLGGLLPQGSSEQPNLATDSGCWSSAPSQVSDDSSRESMNRSRVCAETQPDCQRVEQPEKCVEGNQHAGGQGHIDSPSSPPGSISETKSPNSPGLGSRALHRFKQTFTGNSRKSKSKLST